MLLGHKVDYFIAARAIDCLLDSPWATNTKKQEAIFTTRESVVEFMDRMLQHKFFHRAKKIIVQKDSKKKKKEDEVESSKEKEQHKEKKKDSKTKDDEEKSEPKKDGDKEEKKKEKRKIKLDMHLDQIFVDGNEAYVWIYDPTPARSWIIGLLFVTGATLVCLFPLWPQTIRHYIYYLSVAAAFFLVFIIGLAVVRLIIFILIWALTLGRHHLWLLPNLTEDVGFFESFWPLYHYQYRGPKPKEENKDKEESKKEDKENEKTEEKSSSSSKKTKDKEEKEEKSDSSCDQKKKDSDEEDQVHSESSEEQNSDVEKVENGENGFEILDPEDDTTPHNK